MSELQKAGPLWLVGCGNMGGALLRAGQNAGLPPRDVLVVDPVAAEPAAGVTRVDAVPDGTPAPRILVLAVKPQLLDVVAPAVAPHVGGETVLVSILAGVDIADGLASIKSKPRRHVLASKSMGIHP